MLDPFLERDSAAMAAARGAVRPGRPG